MPTIPLFTPTDDPDAWHQVRAPGGSEWWYLEAQDDRAGVRVVAILFDGCPVHPEYLRRYARYRRRPTRVAPPIPRDFPCAYLVIDRAGQRIARFTMDYPPGSFHANDKGDFSVGSHSLSREHDQLVFTLTVASASATLRVMPNRRDVAGEVRCSSDASPISFAGCGRYTHGWQLKPLDVARRGSSALLSRIEQAIECGVFTSSAPAERSVPSPAPGS